MTEQLIILRRDLTDLVMNGEHYDSLGEEGRTSSQELLADPHLSLEVVVKILAKRGKLTDEQLKDYQASLPKTKRRIIFAPRY